MRRRRRRSRGTWLPILGNQSSQNEDLNSSTIYLDLEVPANGTPIFGIVPIVYDDMPDPGGAISPSYDLAGIIGSEYIIKRILGSIFVSRGITTTTSYLTQAASIQVDAGFFVARRGDDAESIGPIGYFDQTVTENLRDYSPNRQETARLPWMWKRQWILGNAPALNELYFNNNLPNLDGSAFFPDTNALYGSIREGTHVDVKSRRRVQKDQRLFFAIQARNWTISDLTTEATAVTGNSHVWASLDVRVFGALAKARSRSAF